ncbi:F-box/FBD/LRR-repeat protein At1g78750 [Linum grandiflorum]
MVHMRNDLGFHLSAIAGRNMEGDDDSSSIDSLSNLPEGVIHHILSFIDTKSAVQTSVLSQQWICAWKHISVLNFDSDSFDRYDSWKRYVEKNPLADLLGFSSDNCSLKTLQLEYFSFSNSFPWYSFLALEKLDLWSCTFFVGPGEAIVDPFSDLPSLKHLKLSLFDTGDNADTRFRISGLQLLSLRLVTDKFCRMEIHAPKLGYFYLDYISKLVEFTELTLPCLDHAHIRVVSYSERYEVGGGNGYITRHMIPLFHGLDNATSLVLGLGTNWILEDISDYLETQPSPFKRLKFLILNSSCYRRKKKSLALVNYFLKGSSNVTPVVKFISQSYETSSFGL